jgi:hypothetical protein
MALLLCTYRAGILPRRLETYTGFRRGENAGFRLQKIHKRANLRGLARQEPPAKGTPRGVCYSFWLVKTSFLTSKPPKAATDVLAIYPLSGAARLVSFSILKERVMFWESGNATIAGGYGEVAG